MAAILVATFILLGFDLVTALVVFLTIMMIIIDIMGMMYLWDINLNALSLVNLVMVRNSMLQYFISRPYFEAGTFALFSMSCNQFYIRPSYFVISNFLILVFLII